MLYRVLSERPPTGNPIRWHNRSVEKGGSASPRHLPVTVRRLEETGFTLIEVLLAFTILSILFFAVERAAIGGVTASSVAAQRATATSVATQAIAEAQALPFADLQMGLNSSQLQAALGSWPEVAPSGGGNYTLQLSGVSPLPILVANSAVGGQQPLVPFSSVVQLGGVSYAVGVFPTGTGSPPSLVTVTAIVSWVGAPNHTLTTAVEQVVVGVQ
jgi:prepilin-type N-terminal cleavage/methylation domain-containing protein